MRIFITKNGRQLGPFTLEQVQAQVAAGTLEVTDWAWYEGQADWVPLNHIPGFAAYDPALSPGLTAPPEPRRHRPVMVWIISIFYFVTVPFSILYVAIFFPLVLSGTIPSNDATKTYVESLNFFDYGMIILNDLIYLAGAIFLFLLRKPALYCFGITFILGILNLLYQIAFKNWLTLVESNTITMVSALIGIGFSYLIYCSVLAYVGYLYFNKTLR